MKMRMRALLAALLLLLICTAAYAETGSVSVRLHAGETNVEGALIAIFRIGDARIEDVNRVFEINAAFSGSGETLGSLNDKALPGKLAAYAQEMGISPQATAVTDANGTARFEALEDGAYLICQQGFKGKRYFTEIEPFIVTVPMTLDGAWQYDIETAPKVEPKPTPVPTPAPTRPPEDPKLPQTGLQRWLVVALAIGGVTVFLLGWGLCFVKRKDR